MTTARLTLLVSVLAAIAAPAAHGAITAGDIGIADQKADMFADPRFGALGLGRARIYVAYDILDDAAQTAALDAWMSAAQADGVRPLVTFYRSRRPGRKSVRPSPRALAKQFRALRARYPFVTEWVTWNEANLSQGARLTARQWLALKKACRSCTILAADLVDRPNIARWARQFVRAAHRQPRAWGIHNYADANQYRTRWTRSLLRAVKGDVWFTETGGVVRRNNGSPVKYRGESNVHAAKALRYLFSRLVTLSPRVKRVYLYHWDGAGDAGWDSALIGPDGAPRPAYSVLANELRRLRR